MIQVLGLSEENSIETAVELDRGRFQVTFDLQKVEKYLRNPLESVK